MKFLPFAERVLRLRLTAPQRVLALVSLDGVEPANLDGAERDLARQLFGDVEHVPPMARETLVWSLGRGSGKTTLSAAVGLWRLTHGDASACGPGDVPAVVVVAPRRPTARLAVRMARAMVRAVPALDRRVVKGEDTKDGFAIRRPDGRVVQFAAHAAARGGVTGRGFSVLAVILDEAEFFASGSDYLVTDADVHAALVPRLLPGGISLFISTPWPVPTLMGELAEKNHGDPHTALVAVGPSLVMRPDRPDLARRIEAEREKDEANAAREFECDRQAAGSSTFFDAQAIARAVDHDLALPVPPADGAAVGVGTDLGFVRDSSAFVAVERDGNRARVVQLDELRPQRGEPLKPSAVVSQFVDAALALGAPAITSDVHYRETLREGCEGRIRLDDAPEGASGKWESYVELRRQLHEGELRIPAHPRLVAQLRNVVSKPLPGGGMQLSQPRRSGLAHGDLVSALVLAAWAARQADVFGRSTGGGFATGYGSFESAPASPGVETIGADARELRPGLWGDS